MPPYRRKPSASNQRRTKKKRSYTGYTAYPATAPVRRYSFKRRTK